MKRKYVPLISILLLAIFFGAAATCNMCGLSMTTPTAATETAFAGTTDNTQEDSASAETATAKETAAEDAAAEGTVAKETKETSDSKTTDSQQEAPTIKLQIYEGPTYSQADNVCYYRIEAIVAGSPAPTVTFSKDDSNGAFGSKKVQVNLTKSSQSYTLTAKAKNSAGEATDSIILDWGCNAPKTEKTIEIFISDYGTISEFKGITGGLFIGYFKDHDERGRFAFDLNILSGKEITYAQLKLINPDFTTDPCDFMGDIAIFYNDFLPDITEDDYYNNNVYGNPAVFSWNADPLQFSDDFLKNKVKERADSGTKLQFGIGFTKPVMVGPSELYAWRTYYKDDIILTVKYME